MMVAYTFVDYEVDPAGFAESLTWSQVYQRARVVADELSVCGSVGDRAVILAPQGLDYVVAFLGALQAGFIAVPLSVPQFGTHDERVSGVLRDCSPVAILTTSAVVDAVMPLSGAQPGGSVPSVVEVDALDLDSPRMLDAGGGRYLKAAYLQYTAGSTRQPAGVMVSHRNLVTNFEQVMSDFFEDYGKVPPPDTTVVSWLPFYHDCRVEEAGRLGRGGAAQASHHQTGSRLGDQEFAQLAGGGSRPRAARLDTDHHKRQGPPRCVRGALSAERIRPPGHRMTAFDDAELRHWLVDYVDTNIGCSPNDVDFEASLKDLGTTRWGSFLADIDAFDAEFLEISPIKKIRSKGRVGV